MSRWHVLAIGVLGLILAGLIYLTSDPRSTVSTPELALREALAPLQAGFSASVRWAAETAEAVRTFPEVRAENRALRQRVAALEAQLEAARLLQWENASLREALGLRQRIPASTVAARVIARPAEHWFSALTLGSGSRDGLAPGMPVVDTRGVVGHIESVTPNTARVILITDARSAVGGVVAGSEDPVLVEGTGDPAGRRALVHPLVRGTRLAAGDVIVTSGLSEIFPKGIPIGIIEQVEEGETGLQVRGILRPYVDLARLQWVTVILNPGEELEWPPEAADRSAPAGEGTP